jgi:4-diphosphocytidyl-2-C-methyl-D-erythritol kinase
MLTLPISKINIGLYVTEKRPDGYHNLETIFYPIPLHDNLEINRLKDSETCDYRLHLAGAKIAGEAEDNLIIKILRSLKEDFDIPSIDIHLYKRIPMGAGLGGGSSDAAAFIKGLNEMFDLKMSNNEMEKRVSKFGADCAFFIQQQPCFATGIGNILTPINLSLKGYYLILVKPDDFVSTKEAYAGVTPCKPNIDLMQAIQQPINTWKDSISNDFEKSVFATHPKIAAIKETLYDLGAVYASMSGSGSTVFGIFEHRVEELSSIFSDCFCFQEKLRF